MTNELKRQIIEDLLDAQRHITWVIHSLNHETSDYPLILKELKLLKKKSNDLLNKAKEEYRKECYGFRKEQK